MAAAYLFLLVKYHPFEAGNERIGTVAAIEFLDLNRIVIAAGESVLERFVMDVAESNVGKDAIADFLRQNSKSSAD
ncbi:MAG: Fic family protein [bacterium]|nr:Fic family protein [bacterium]